MEKACINLWAAVLDQAIQDALRDVPSREGKVEYIFKKRALNWFFNRSEGIGSFLWISSILDIDPKSVLAILSGTEHVPFEQKALADSMGS